MAMLSVCLLDLFYNGKFLSIGLLINDVPSRVVNPIFHEYLDIPGLLILKGLKLFLAHKYLEQNNNKNVL